MADKSNSEPGAPNPRLVAVNTLKRIVSGSGSLDHLLASDQLTSEVRPLVYEMVYGVLRHYFSLCAIVDQHMKSPLRKKDRDIYCVLLLGAYQLTHMRIPAYAAVNESVKLSKALRKPWSRAMINAILRNIARELDSEKLEQPEQIDTRAHKQPSDEARHDHPTWMINRFKSAYPQRWEEILRINNTRAPLALRTNLSRISRDKYLKLLLDAGHPAHSGTSRAAICLDTASNVQNLPGWEDGYISVQDEGAQQLSTLISLKPGTRILDACAAPGGKSMLVLEQNPGVLLTALDVDPTRLARINDESKRLNLAPPLLLTGDATGNDWKKDALPYDYIILDAPCSGSGTIRRHPDIKLLKQDGDINKFTELQLQLLQNLWATLSEGGTLLYATCSIFPEENDLVIKTFLAHTDNACLRPIDLDTGQETAFGYQLLPCEGGHDGFYFSLLEKQQP